VRPNKAAISLYLPEKNKKFQNVGLIFHFSSLSYTNPINTMALTKN
jgi:hypothetical protein